MAKETSKKSIQKGKKKASAPGTARLKKPVPDAVIPKASVHRFVQSNMSGWPMRVYGSAVHDSRQIIDTLVRRVATTAFANTKARGAMTVSESDVVRACNTIFGHEFIG